MEKFKTICECGAKKRYNRKYDVYYCSKCNKWLERKCSDPYCEFCSKRPKKPIEE